MLANKLIEIKAAQFRQRNGLTAVEPVDLNKLLVKLEVIAVFRNCSGSFSGMALKSGDHRFMLVNTSDILARQNFTVGHELYHLFIQEGFTNQICKVGNFDKKDVEEYNADWFASYLLMPEGGINQMIPAEELVHGEITLGTVVRLEQYFSVSRSAILNRLRFMGLIKKDQMENYRKKGEIVRSALMMGYTDELYTSGNQHAGKVIGNYGEKAKRLFDNELISETDYHHLMLEIGIDLDQKFEEDGKAAG